MFKSLIKSLLPVVAVARGTGDGSDSENASKLGGVDPGNNQSKLHTEMQYWNELDTQGKPILFGETVAFIKQDLAGYFAYGFCMEISADDETWDCQRVNVKPAPVAEDPTKNSDMSQFISVDDLIYTGAISSAPVLNWDKFSTAVPDTKNSYTVNDQTSFTKCGEDSSGKVTCPSGDSGDSGIVLRWSRPFDTDDAEDKLLKLDEGGQTIRCFSYLYGWDSEPEDWSTTKPSYEHFNWNPANMAFVSEKFSDDVAAQKETEENIGDEIQEELEDIYDDVQDKVDESMGWLYENEWAIGVIYLIAGPLIALFGAKWFPYIVASLVALFTMTVICGISLTAGWMVSMAGTIVTVCVALIAGIVLACIVRRNFKVMLGLLGLIAGFFSGSLIFALISGMTGGSWHPVWGFWVISCLLAIIGCIAAIYLGLPLVMIATSLVGSYLFMRSWTLFFPGDYPSEAELIATEEEDVLEMGGIFWLYIGIFIISFVITLTIQCKYSKHHDDLENDDNFKKA